jgi:hypothetical protein
MEQQMTYIPQFVTQPAGINAELIKIVVSLLESADPDPEL